MLKNELKKQGDFLFQYRGIIPLVFLVIGVVVFIDKKLQFAAGGISFPIPYYMVVCMAISLLGQLIRILTVGYAPANTSGRNIAKQIADQLNTRGIYSVVRHPLYLGNFFMWLGITMLSFNLWFILFFILIFWVYYERIMFAEEVFLEDKFGEGYKNWASGTPAFIPDFRNYKKNVLSFSWKKVLKKEKNGLTAVFILFFLFDFISLSLNSGKFIFRVTFDFWSYAAIFSTGIYLILKILKRKTLLFEEPGR